MNTRDEPHADPQKYRRLHVIVGDANLCEVATFLKTGATAIVLAMILAVRGIGDGGSVVINYIAAFLIVSIVVLTIQRLGLVATVMLSLVNFVMSNGIVTLDTSRWFFAGSLVQLLVPASLAAYTVFGLEGSTAIARTWQQGSPFVTSLQVAPPSFVLNTEKCK